MNQKVIFILSIFIISTFAESERIAGGEISSPGDFKYHVKLEPSTGSFRRLCGGALIRIKWVITVAQCIYNARDVIVRLGVVDRLSGPEGAFFWVQHSHIITHENYSYDTVTNVVTNDIGLIYLEDATEDILQIEDENNIRIINTIALPTRDLDLDISRIGIAAGFGFYEGGDNASYSMNLRYAPMNTMTLQDCISYHGNTKVTDRNFCTDNTLNSSTCIGDEGGPFAISADNGPTLLGLVSTTFKECTVGHPSIFTNVVFFLDWIMGYTGIPPVDTTVEPPITTPPDNCNCKCECHCYTCPPLPETPTQRSSFWDD